MQSILGCTSVIDSSGRADLLVSVMKEEQLKRLIYHYRKALQIKPNNPTAYDRMAELYYEQGELDKTLFVCQEAFQTQLDLIVVPKILQKMLQTLGFKGEEIAALQHVLQTQSDIDFYLALEKILSLSAKVKTADTKIWKDAMSLGYVLKEKKQWNEAVTAYLKAIEIEPALFLSHTALYSIIKSSISPLPNQIETITNLYYQLSQERIVSPFIYIVLGDMLTKQGKIAKAITAYKTGIQKTIYLNENYPIKSLINLNQFSQVNFLIIGVGKSGTSALYYYLSKHPKIVPPLQKELFFFDKNFELGLDWYIAHFPPLPLEGGFLTGEATPWYFGQDGIAEKVFQVFPNIKLMLLLRNPVSRAISHYYMNFKKEENRSLEAAINSELEILDNLENPSQVSGKYWRTEQGYLWFGLYVYFLEKWMALFPKEQFLILRSEDLYNQSAKTMQQVYEFLELPDYSLFNYPKPNSGSYPNVSHELRRKLSDFFRPHNQKLEDYLGMKFNWG